MPRVSSGTRRMLVILVFSVFLLAVAGLRANATTGHVNGPLINHSTNSWYACFYVDYPAYNVHCNTPVPQGCYGGGVGTDYCWYQYSALTLSTYVNSQNSSFTECVGYLVHGGSGPVCKNVSGSGSGSSFSGSSDTSVESYYLWSSGCGSCIVVQSYNTDTYYWN